MITLDEAIKHAEEIAEEKESEAQNLEYSKLDWKYEANQCFECAKDHRQLAEWLTDYKRLLEQEPCDECKYFDGNSCQHYDYKVGYTQGYEDASKPFRQEPCDGVINRQVISDYVGSHIQEINTGYGDLNKHTNEILRMIVDYIESMPSVRPQEQTGHWNLLDECANSGYYCSICQKKLVKEGWSKTVKKIKFCPNCGVRMVEPQERSGEE